MWTGLLSPILHTRTFSFKGPQNYPFVRVSSLVIGDVKCFFFSKNRYIFGRKYFGQRKNGATVIDINVNLRKLIRLFMFGPGPAGRLLVSWVLNLEKCYENAIIACRMLWRVIHAILIDILEICYAMAEFAFLHFSIEALVINFY